MADCPDCGVPPGTAHVDGCDVARCLWSGMQRLMCGGDAAGPLTGEGVIHDCGQDVWTGRWPGDVECEEFGWFTEVSIPGQFPVRVHDLNRLVTECRWDRARARWVRR